MRVMKAPKCGRPRVQYDMRTERARAGEVVERHSRPRAKRGVVFAVISQSEAEARRRAVADIRRGARPRRPGAVHPHGRPVGLTSWSRPQGRRPPAPGHPADGSLPLRQL
jgi:hypothetical protein